MPDTFGNAVDFAVNLDPITETGNALEGSLNQEPQITITVPGRTMNLRSDATSVRPLVKSSRQRTQVIATAWRILKSSPQTHKAKSVIARLGARIDMCRSGFDSLPFWKVPLGFGPVAGGI